MLKKKIIIVGKRSLVANFFIKKLQRKLKIYFISFKTFKSLSSKKIKQYDYIINFSLNKDYLIKKVKLDKDHDYYISKKIKNISITQIILSSRKVYQPKINIFENSKLKPTDFYGYNKKQTEIRCKKILNNLIILRPSNIIVDFVDTKNRLHKNFLNFFLDYYKEGTFVVCKKDFKDFITIDQFALAIFEIIKKDINRGIFNLSLGQKVYIHEILKWLMYKANKKIKFTYLDKTVDESFTLNNSKLLKIISVKFAKKDLKSYCKMLSNKINKIS